MPTAPRAPRTRVRVRGTSAGRECAATPQATSERCAGRRRRSVTRPRPAPAAARRARRTRPRPTAPAAPTTESLVLATSARREPALTRPTTGRPVPTATSAPARIRATAASARAHPSRVVPAARTRSATTRIRATASKPASPARAGRACRSTATTTRSAPRTAAAPLPAARTPICPTARRVRMGSTAPSTIRVQPARAFQDRLATAAERRVGPASVRAATTRPTLVLPTIFPRPRPATTRTCVPATIAATPALARVNRSSAVVPAWRVMTARTRIRARPTSATISPGLASTCSSPAAFRTAEWMAERTAETRTPAMRTPMRRLTLARIRRPCPRRTHNPTGGRAAMPAAAAPAAVAVVRVKATRLTRKTNTGRVLAASQDPLGVAAHSAGLLLAALVLLGRCRRRRG